MSIQLNLLACASDLKEEEREILKKYLKYPTKRIRYKRPNYLNFYTLYQYDRNKFRELLRAWHKTDEAIKEKNKSLESWLIVLQAKQDEILEQCYIRDENGNKLRDSDAKHIYRYRTLHNIMNEIYKIIHWEFIKTGSIFNVEGLTVSSEEEIAEIHGTEWYMSVKDRIIIHLRLLRLLRKGLSISECMKQIKKGE